MTTITTAPACLTDIENDIPLQLAINAHNGTSFVPDERGRNERVYYAERLRNDYAQLLEYAGGTASAEAILAEEFPRYREGTRKRTIAYLASRSRIVSVMIAGPSNFPSARMRKRNDSADNKYDDLREYRERALKAIRKRLNPNEGAIMTGDADAVTRLELKIQAAEAKQDQMKRVNAAIRKHKTTEDQASALAKLGFPQDFVAEVLKPDHVGRIGFPSYELQNNNANIRRMKQRLEQVKTLKTTPEGEWIGLQARVADAPAENRVRILFPGEPDAATRMDMKKNGFRWAPSQNAWQAYRNPRTIAYAKRIAQVESENESATNNQE